MISVKQRFYNIGMFIDQSGHFLSLDLYSGSHYLWSLGPKKYHLSWISPKQIISAHKKEGKYGLMMTRLVHMALFTNKWCTKAYVMTEVGKMVNVHKVDIIFWGEICWLQIWSLEVWRIFYYCSSKIWSHICRNRDIRDSNSRYHLLYARSFFYHHTEHSSIIVQKVTSTGTFCDNCSAEVSDKRNLIFCGGHYYF